MRPNSVVDKLCCEGFETALKKNISKYLKRFIQKFYSTQGRSGGPTIFGKSLLLQLKVYSWPMCVCLNQTGYSDYPKRPILIIVVCKLNALIECHKDELRPLILLPSTAINFWKTLIFQSRIPNSLRNF